VSFRRDQCLLDRGCPRSDGSFHPRRRLTSTGFEFRRTPALHC
jgi:hypothetical protein